MTVVRPATADNKRSWPFLDLQRPLDARGEEISERLGLMLLRHPVARLVSSPAVRCIQTLGFLAERRDLPIELCDSVGPDGVIGDLVGMLTDDAFDNAVVCAHGELVAQLLDIDGFGAAARASGVPRRMLMTRGTAWRLRVSPTGEVLKFVYLAPGDD